jgi:hypothetical protein
MRTSLILILSWLCLARVNAEEDRIVVEGAKINGAAVRLFLDTGADRMVLFSSSAERLGLKVSPVRGLWRQRLYTATEKCTVDFWGFSQKERIPVIFIPAYLHATGDGVVGWGDVSDKVLVFNTLSNTVKLVRKVPEETAQWVKLKLGIWYDILALKAPDHGKTGIIVVDTGSASGVGLPARRWREWKGAHAGQPVTLAAFYMPSAGLIVREQAWAMDFTLGTVALTDVVVEEADPVSSSRISRRHLATLGLAALRRVDLVVDGRNDVAYLRPKTTPPPEYRHNRAGAVFVPTNEQSDVLHARVMDGSPAYEAGVREGDILLSIGDEDAANWRSFSNTFGAFWDQKAGTQVGLTLQRGNETLKTTVTLRDILPPKTQ